MKGGRGPLLLAGVALLVAGLGLSLAVGTFDRSYDSNGERIYLPSLPACAVWRRISDTEQNSRSYTLSSSPTS